MELELYLMKINKIKYRSGDMEIKHDTYRSTPLVNQDDDMMRVTITLPRRDGKKLLSKLDTIDKIPNRDDAERFIWETIFHSHPDHWCVQGLLDKLGFPKQ